MDSTNTAQAHHDDEDLVEVTLEEFSGTEEPNLTCDNVDDETSWQIITSSSPSDAKCPASSLPGAYPEDSKDDGLGKVSEDTTPKP